MTACAELRGKWCAELWQHGQNSEGSDVQNSDDSMGRIPRKWCTELRWQQCAEFRGSDVQNLRHHTLILTTHKKPYTYIFKHQADIKTISTAKPSLSWTSQNLMRPRITTKGEKWPEEKTQFRNWYRNWNRHWTRNSSVRPVTKNAKTQATLSDSWPISTSTCKRRRI